MGDAKKPIALHEPCFTGNEWDYVKDCLDSTYVSSVGAYVDKFEKALQDFTGVKRAVAVVNGTAALHIALKLAGVEAGDEVLVPALTFVATANAVVYLGGAPHLADSDDLTLGLDPVKLQAYLEEITAPREGGCYNRFTGRRIRAVVPVHTFGHPADLEALQEVCTRFRLVMVEDGAEALGSFYKGRHTGNWGQSAIISFNGNKIITTGGGGAILTNDEELGRQAKHLTTTARQQHRWVYSHDQVGYNYRLPNINAALGCAQMEKLPEFLEKKRRLAGKYAAAFQGVAGVRFFTEPAGARSNYWLNVLLLNDKNCAERDRVLEETNNQGIMTRPAWTLMHQLPMFKDCPRMDLSGAEGLEARLINIPSSPNL